jgi:RHS repeat-associated protein
VKDHLSSIRTVLNGSGAALATYSFDPWGRRLLASGTDVTTRGFTGLRVADEGSMAALRAYDADAGRWLGEDPIGVADGLNLYTYVRNNPLSFVDPSGAVRVQSSPTTYSTTSDLDQLTRQCNGGFQWACTRVRMGTGCECYQNSCGSWSPSVTIVSSIEVYIWSKHPRFSVELLRTEEDKHVMTAMSVLDSWIASGEAFEKRTFMSKATCNLNCWAWQKRRKFELVYYSFFPHIATPHPR